MQGCAAWGRFPRPACPILRTAYDAAQLILVRLALFYAGTGLALLLRVNLFARALPGAAAASAAESRRRSPKTTVDLN